MDLEKLRELLELIAEQDVTEFELEEEGLRLQIKKQGALVEPVVVASPPPMDPVAAAPAAPTNPADSSAGPATDTGAPAEEGLEGCTIVPSPMVGTFYRASEPGAKPFTDKGERVSPGQVLCIIEAMKLMNEIESEHTGEVVRIFMENGQTVQYGDRLFALRED